MRNTFAQALYERAKRNPEIFVIVADISPAGPMAEFQKEYPERFINVGVAEQAMTGIAAGLALKGCQPFTYTIATFTLYRPFEFVRDDLCYQNLPVTVVGMGSGAVYSVLGATHQTIEDVAIAAAIPNMQVLVPCDPRELVECVEHCAFQRVGPIYLKIGKTGEPDLTANAVEPWRFGKIRHLRKGTDICIFVCGPIARRAAALADRLSQAGHSVSVVSVHTLKPLDREGIAGALKAHKRSVVIEEHVPHGGLSSRIKEIAFDSGVTTRLDAFTLQDKFFHFYGTHDEFLDMQGLSIEAMYNRIAG